MMLAEARPAYQYPVRPVRRQVRKAARRTAPKVERRPAAAAKSRYVLVWLVAVALTLGVASRFALAAKLTVDIAALNKQLAQVQAENEQLQLQVASLKSPARIEQIATARLGMIRPTVTRPIVVPSAEKAPVTAAASVRSESQQSAAGSWIVSVQRWLARLVRLGLAEARGL